MKQFISLLLAIFIAVPCMSQNAVLDNIHSRKSVRSYENTPIEEATLITIVKAGMAAPSGMNKQPWEFLVVNGRKNLDKVCEKMGGRGASLLKKASAAIVVIGNPDVSENWMLDCSAASENILLAAESLGLGAVWTAGYPYQERISSIKESFGIPDPYIPLCVIPIGYPEGKQVPKDKWKPEKLHMNKW